MNLPSHRAKAISRLIALVVGVFCLLVPLAACGGPDKNAAVRSGMAIVQKAIEGWSLDHDTSYPGAKLVRNGKTTFGYSHQAVSGYVNFPTYGWPTNPFTGHPVTQGTAPGDFTYTELGAFEPGFTCAGYRLVAYGAGGKPLLILGQETWNDALGAEEDSLQSLVEAWAKGHRGVLPSTRLVTENGLGRIYAGRQSVFWPGVWPVNPFTGEPLHPGTGPGDYRYVRVSSSRFRLIVLNRHGKPIH